MGPSPSAIPDLFPPPSPSFFDETTDLPCPYLMLPTNYQSSSLHSNSIHQNLKKKTKK